MFCRTVEVVDQEDPLLSLSVLGHLKESNTGRPEGTDCRKTGQVRQAGILHPTHPRPAHSCANMSALCENIHELPRLPHMHVGHLTLMDELKTMLPH